MRLEWWYVYAAVLIQVLKLSSKNGDNIQLKERKERRGEECLSGRYCNICIKLLGPSSGVEILKVLILCYVK